ncbi:MAG TPA: SGNH/GDSL hydrolase family protein [Vicinamibacteria bacterium]|nr:SGNH/GDSL hydrolase family protein [Vicinamibacteria bacterium]
MTPTPPVPRPFPLLLAVPLAVLLAACGGGGGTSGPAPLPSPSAVPGATVVAVVYYDENGNGRADPEEEIRVPDVEVTVGGRSARSEKRTGRAVVTNVPLGAQTLAIRGETLPPFFTAAQASVGVQVPMAEGAETMIGLTLPIDNNRTNVYMAFGDSITRGDGSQTGGYPRDLEARLAAHFGFAIVSNQGRDSTNSFEGADRMRRNLIGQRPAYTLILYGTNDWHAPECQTNPRCPTVDNLRGMVRTVKAFRSLPVLGTIPPTNPALNPEDRDTWTKAVNDLIRAMAREEGAVVADLYQAFAGQGDLAGLFTDHVHPNDAGYRIISEAFFEAIAHGGAAPATAAGPVIFPAPGTARD